MRIDLFFNLEGVFIDESGCKRFMGTFGIFSEGFEFNALYGLVAA